MKINIFYKTIALLFLIQISSALSAQITPVNLKCEFLETPHGIDEKHPRLSWQSISEIQGQHQTYYQILVADTEKSLEENVGSLWNSGKVKSANSLNISYLGLNLNSFQTCYWKVRLWDKDGNVSQWSAPAYWGMGVLTESDWEAEWINEGGLSVGGQNKVSITQPLNCRKLRKVFHLETAPEKATAYVNVLGFYELFINGKKVGSDVLSPVVSDYSSHSVYNSYDITPYLKRGKNSVGIWLSPGWYRKDSRDYYGISEIMPLARARFNIKLDNGEKMMIRTDRTWIVSQSERELTGNWLWGDFGGEFVDGSKTDNDWANAEYDDSSWEKAYNYKPSRVPAIAQKSEPTVIKKTLSPVNLIKLNDTTFLADFGSVITGFLKVDIRNSKPGALINMLYGDKLIRPGDDTSPLEMNFTITIPDDRQKRKMVIYNQKDAYLTAGKDREVFENKFNYHAFRWVLIRGLKELQAEDLQAMMIQTDFKQAAVVETSNELLNSIWALINHTYECLSHTGYVVDCPHRERIGYGGDSHSSLETALCNFDLSAFFNKWLVDWRVNQYPTGFWTNSAPEPPQHNYGFNPGWGSFGIALPWRYYNYYGDTLNLKRSYYNVTRYIHYLNLNVKDGLLYNDSDRAFPGRGFIGDWVPPGYDMSREGRIDDHSTHLFNNCIYIYCLDMAKKMAAILDIPEDMAYYQELIDYSSVKIHEFFFNEETTDYANGQQPYLAFPLLTNIVPENLREAVHENLVKLITRTNKGHLQTGMLGTHFMFEYLMKANRNDLIYLMMNQKTYPGWGYMVEQGATTVWEQWNGHNSQVHNCYLAGGAWFIRGLGGIKVDEKNPGMKHFYIVPAFIDDLEFANVSFDSPYGQISSSWKRTGKMTELVIEVPCNTTATLIIPEPLTQSVYLNGIQIKNLNESEDYAGKEIKLTSGDFLVKLKN